MKRAEHERMERIQRNQAMLRNVTGAAADLAACADPASPVEDSTARKESFMAKLASEAQQHGFRKSSRLASTAAAKRISNSLHKDGEQLSAGSVSASGSLDLAETSDEDDSGLQESARSQEDGAQDGHAADSAVPEVHQLQGTPDVLPSDEDDDMQLAIAISLAGDGVVNGGGGGKRSAGPSSGTTSCLASQSRNGRSEQREPNGARSEGGEHKKAGRKRKKRLDLSGAEVDAIFEYVGEGKVTIGRAEVIKVINKLGLDVDDTMVDAAFELLQESGCAGACNRVDRSGLRRFVDVLNE